MQEPKSDVSNDTNTEKPTMKRDLASQDHLDKYVALNVIMNFTEPIKNEKTK